MITHSVTYSTSENINFDHLGHFTKVVVPHLSIAEGSQKRSQLEKGQSLAFLLKVSLFIPEWVVNKLAYGSFSHLADCLRPLFPKRPPGEIRVDSKLNYNWHSLAIYYYSKNLINIILTYSPNLCSSNFILESILRHNLQSRLKWDY